jgi:hypothetical protein
MCKAIGTYCVPMARLLLADAGGLRRVNFPVRSWLAAKAGAWGTTRAN